MRNQIGFGKILDPEFFAPPFQNLGGSAMIKTAVDLAAAAYAAAFDIGNFVTTEGNGLAAVAVFLQHFVNGKGPARFLGIKWTFFDQQDIASGFGEQARGQGPAGARTNYDNFATQVALCRSGGIFARA